MEETPEKTFRRPLTMRRIRIIRNTPAVDNFKLLWWRKGVRMKRSLLALLFVSALSWTFFSVGCGEDTDDEDSVERSNCPVIAQSKCKDNGVYMCKSYGWEFKYSCADHCTCKVEQNVALCIGADGDMCN